MSKRARVATSSSAPMDVEDVISKSLEETTAKADTEKAKSDPDTAHVVVIMGASGDLAKKSIYPALWHLYRRDHLPKNTFMVGFARSKLTVPDVRKKCEEFIKVGESKEEQEKYEAFWAQNFYTPGSYSNAEDAVALDNLFEEIESQYKRSDRTFYLALPPSVYKSVTSLINENWMATKGRTKIAIEKPFGRDLESSNDLDQHLSSMFREDQMCRVDHYLCLEMVEAILTLRFGNKMFSNCWNNKNVASVMITFKEDFGTYGRGGYFDDFGIIRDVMQNHLLQVLALVAMERPLINSDEEIKLEKARLIRCIRPVDKKDIVLGQYVKNEAASQDSEAAFGYKDDEGVDKDSVTPTYATIVFRIDNERWNGVPFIMRCGKATNEVKDEVRIQFKSADSGVVNLLPGRSITRNELVIQLKPKEKIALRITTKHPGLRMDLEDTELDLNYRSKYSEEEISGPYERLFLSMVNDSEGSHFVGKEELYHSWKLFTPLLEMVEGKEGNPETPIPYKFGSLGPEEADELCALNNFQLSEQYPW